jgi:hypothetical protein
VASHRKHFLDEHPYPLHLPEARELRDLLARTVRQDNVIVTLLAEAGIPVHDVNLQGSSAQIWTSALQVAADHLRLRALVTHAKKIRALAARLSDLERSEAQADLSADTTVAGAVPSWRGAEPDGVERLLSTTSTLLDVSFLQRGIAVASGVVLIRAYFGISAKLGTAFRVGPRHLLTNHHVVFADSDPTRCAERIELYLGFEVRLDNSVTTERVLPDDSHKVLAYERQEHPARDWALVELAQPLPDTMQTIPLSGAPAPQVDQRAYIIQHPGGLPKKVGLNRNLIRYVDGDVVQYLTDTEQGSSGSPVFNERWQLIALHYRYIESKDEDKYGYRNQGMRIEPIVAALKGKGLELSAS